MRHPILRSYAVTHPAGSFRLPQTAGWDQLVHAASGTVRITTAQGSWTLPPDRAAWVRAGTEYLCAVRGGTRMRTLYIHRDAGPPLLRPRLSVLDLGPLARQLLLRLVERAPLYDSPTTQSWLTVLREEVVPAAVAPLQLPMPDDAALRQVATAVLDNVGARWSVADVAGVAGRSRRSLERHWQQATGLPVAQWVTRARLVVALDRLAAGEPVGHVASHVGYSTQSAFGAMFRAQLGASPLQYLGHREP